MTYRTEEQLEDESELVVKVNGAVVVYEPEETERAVKFFARIADDHGIKAFDVKTSGTWGETMLAKDLAGVFDIVKVDKPGC
jgi:hypothetical protein